MILCRVVGTVVGTEKHPAYHGRTLLLCQPLDEHDAEKGDAIIAVDHAQAGVGDRVLVMREGNGVRQLLGATKLANPAPGDCRRPSAFSSRLPIRSLIVGIVDDVHLAGA